MSLKTEFTPFNEDNFIQRDGKLQELTVEISLEEYRNLIIERVYNEKEIEKLQQENNQLNDSLETLTKIYIDKNPEIKEALSFLLTKTWTEIKKAFEGGGSDA